MDVPLDIHLTHARFGGEEVNATGLLIPIIIVVLAILAALLLAVPAWP